MRVMFRIVLALLVALPFLIGLMILWVLQGGWRTSPETPRPEYTSPAKASSD